MPRFWIDIEDAAGNHLGSGPIITATSWESSPRLDAAGSFRFTMPASDPKSALLLRKRIARCWTERDGELVEVGAGIIDSVEKQIGNPTMLTVSGPDLLAELGTRTVHGLGVFDMDWVFLSAGRGSVRRLGSTEEWDLPEAYDGNYATYTGEIVLRTDRWLYVGFDTRYNGIAYTIQNYNTSTSVAQYQYYRNDNSWADLSGVVDNTIVSGRPFARNGTVTFTPPTDWARTTPTLASGSWFWIRCRRRPVVGGNDITFSLYEVRVYAPIPTTDGINRIMAYAPPGWTTSGYPQTDAEHYLVFDGASVLSALIALCEQGGQDGGEAIREHFRLGTGREIDWLGTATEHSGIHAVQRTNTPEAPELCQIADLSVKDDASEVVTRVYPVSQDGVTLALTDRTPPAGYTLSTGGNYVEHDAGVAAFGRIERVERFGELAAHQEGSWLVLPRMVANALFDRTVEYLRTRAVEQSYYALSVVDLSETLLPGQQVDVVYHDYVDGYHVVDIDDTLTLLGTTVRIDEQGVTTVALEVATVDRQPQTDAGVVVDLVKRSQLPGATGGALGFVVMPGEPSTTLDYQAGVDLLLDGTTFNRAGNVILVYHGDGSTLTEYELSEDGLTAALGASTAGDVVLLPPGEIAGDHVVPAGVTLEGMGRASVLTGALWLEDGASAESLDVVRTADGSDDLVGLLGPSSGGALARDVHVSLVHTGTGKALGMLGMGGTLRTYGCEIWVHGGDGSAWAAASAAAGAAELNQGQVKAWRTV